MRRESIRQFQCASAIIAVLFLFLGLLASTSVMAETVFEGTPINKITISEADVIEEGVSGSKAQDFRVVIEQHDDTYFWASRENVQLIPVRSGAFTTFIATNGSGYVRVLAKPVRQIGDQLPESERGFYYMEHLIHQMGSITYQGR